MLRKSQFNQVTQINLPVHTNNDYFTETIILIPGQIILKHNNSHQSTEEFNLGNEIFTKKLVSEIVPIKTNKYL